MARLKSQECEKHGKTLKFIFKRKSISKKDNLVDTSQKNNHKCFKLAAAEIVGNNTKLMSEIIKMIPEISERGNLKMTCKRYYILCNKKNNCTEFLKLKNRNANSKFNWASIRWENSESYLKVIGHTLAISIRKMNLNDVDYLEEQRTMIEVNRFRITNLEIESIDSNSLEFFGSLNCLENVETISFHPINAMPLALKIFKYCTSLKPKTIIFNWFHPSKPVHHFDYSLNEMIMLIPKTVKNIQLNCGKDDVEWLYELFKYIPKGYFEKLILGKEFLFEYSRTPEFRHKLLLLSKCFNTVEIYLDKTLCFNVINYLVKDLPKFEMDISTRIMYDITINLHKEPYSRFSPLEHEIMPEDVNLNIVNSNFLNFHCFRVECKSSWKKPPARYVNPFLNVIPKMSNLTTLELSLRIFNSLEDFDNLCKSLNANMKNVKLSHCEELTVSSIKVLADSCKMIKNLLLESIKSSIISIAELISLFKNLMGLSILFTQSGENIKSFKDSLTNKQEDNCPRINWPHLDFLQVVFSGPRKVDKKSIEQIDKSTPRKCGKFIIKYHPKVNQFSTEILEIIIQKSTKSYTDFMEPFTMPNWIKN